MTATDYSAWIGRTEEAVDELSRNLIKRIAATFGETAPAVGQPLPPLWMWCFFQEPVAETQLGTDGHPARGGFLPPADNRNRMWAGGRVEFIAPLKVGAEAHRLSTIVHIEEKHGRTGALLFVTVRHEYSQHGALCVREEQDIVYREPNPPKLGSAQAPVPAQWSEAVTPTPTLLMRYSAVTFNGHRIHYDHPYVTDTEGYAGLVVHGPLIAALNLRAFIRANPGKRVRHFAYRGVRPLTVPTPFVVAGCLGEPGQAQLWASNADGVAQSADVLFD
ncbi:MaoC family dehydratase N-terminal domain-containing protein [Pseudomonas sp. NC26]|uniref:MaoC family dehydratase N-terminal domain-containing protein n=1 Tax=Pseudomonas putida TaxID=303 RepID=A0A7W2L1C4_PSEPU|nr:MULTISPECIES: MaoC family dehydratase N-terminal domain-containing protein [Pseudomonas]MBA6116687.1 MaoC family dehydratase N-terminal domain-containing protein [Pseudomonas putida]MCZ9637361.1 MaoC family dehydratase N-terminal domain-containing protein [Pseudomonas putida]MEC4876935.1 MaoC family dehydratase N-terminal domain-containing protein [Pseudomonas sp. NC26]QNL87788.1 Hydroxyacyl-ACP dehydratase [Pseudomonas putida]